MNSLESHYAHRMRWSLFEALLCNVFLLTYDYILSYLVTAEFYGKLGSIFGCAYFVIKISDFGVSKVLSAGYEHYSANKKEFNHFFLQQLFPTLLFYSLAWLYALYTILSPTTFFFLSPVPSSLVGVVGLFITIEGIKSIIKRIVYFSDSFRATSISEIFFIVGYQTTIYLLYFSGCSLHYSLMIGLCALFSGIELVYLLGCAKKWYNLLPDNHAIPKVRETFFTLRAASFAHNVSKQLLSSNVLVPLFGCLFGFEYAAQLKLISSIIYNVRSLVEKSMDLVSSVFFAYTKRDSLESKQYVFHISSSLLYTIISSLFIFITINYPRLASTFNSTVMYYALFYCLIHMGDLLFLVIDRLYAAHNKSSFMFVQGATNFLLIGIFLFYSPSPTVACFLLTSLRLGLFFVYLFMLPSTWRIQHTFTLYPRYLALSFLASIIFFMST